MAVQGLGEIKNVLKATKNRKSERDIFAYVLRGRDTTMKEVSSMIEYMPLNNSIILHNIPMEMCILAMIYLTETYDHNNIDFHFLFIY